MCRSRPTRTPTGVAVGDNLRTLTCMYSNILDVGLMDACVGNGKLAGMKNITNPLKLL